MAGVNWKHRLVFWGTIFVAFLVGWAVARASEVWIGPLVAIAIALAGVGGLLLYLRQRGDWE